VETVGTAVTLMESMMAEVAHLSPVEQHITAAIKSTIDFEWIRLMTEAARLRTTKSKMKILTHQ
jgi:hypothetical protein